MRLSRYFQHSGPCARKESKVCKKHRPRHSHIHEQISSYRSGRPQLLSCTDKTRTRFVKRPLLHRSTSHQAGGDAIKKRKRVKAQLGWNTVVPPGSKHDPSFTPVTKTQQSKVFCWTQPTLWDNSHSMWNHMFGGSTDGEVNRWILQVQTQQALRIIQWLPNVHGTPQTLDISTKTFNKKKRTKPNKDLFWITLCLRGTVFIPTRNHLIKEDTDSSTSQ